ncbi:hypothetical protein ACWC5C_13890 [Streptomyces sp. NPDC001700]
MALRPEGHPGLVRRQRDETVQGVGVAYEWRLFWKGEERARAGKWPPREQSAI